MTFAKTLGSAALLLAMMLPAQAQTASQSAPQTNPPATEKGALSILFENDIFYNTDHDYTNGVALAYSTAPDDTPDWASDIAHSLPFFTKKGDVRARYAIGQNIYTPNNLALTNPPPGARPYAGFLYGALGVTADSGGHLDQLQLTLGVVGPDSLAEQTQKLVHKIMTESRWAGPPSCITSPA
jgi:lipid A 3-O-deacylase